MDTACKDMRTTQKGCILKKGEMFMKKVLLPVLMFFVFSGVLSAENLESLKGFYIGCTAGMVAGSDSFGDLKKAYEKDPNPDPDVSRNVDAELSQPKFFYGLEIGYESPLISENKLLGVRCGYNWHGTSSLKVNTTAIEGEEVAKSEATVKSKMQSIPVTLYYKYEFEESKFSVLGGIGLTIINMKLTSTFKNSTSTKTETTEGNFSKTRTSPHIAGGLEYRFSKLVALSLDLKYTINSEVKYNDVPFKRDLGFQGALAVRFYAF
jgi:opacity protein-like surface antigen